MTDNFTVAEFILCEDIRSELHGKFSLMGVYGDDVFLFQQGGVSWPFQLKHAVYFRLRQLPPKNLKIRLEVRSGETTLFESENTYVYDPEDWKRNLMMAATLTIAVPNEGTLHSRITATDEAGRVELQHARELRVAPG